MVLWRAAGGGRPKRWCGPAGAAWAGSPAHALARARGLFEEVKAVGAFVPGIRPGRRTADYLEKIMVRITLAGATFLAVIALVPQSVQIWLGTDPNLAMFLGGTSILITVSVALDLVDKLNSHLLMRNYEGFMKGGGRRGKR